MSEKFLDWVDLDYTDITYPPKVGDFISPNEFGRDDIYMVIRTERIDPDCLLVVLWDLRKNCKAFNVWHLMPDTKKVRWPYSRWAVVTLP